MLGDRMRRAFLKPADPDAGPPPPPQSAEELEEAVRTADDKERLTGVLMAPFAAAIGLLIIDAEIANDPPARLRSGALDKAHVSVGLYHELLIVLLGVSLVMLVVALLRKRLYLGIVMALYGLAVFNLHYWGFGIPYLLAGSWLLVRSYRLQRDLKEATSGGRPAPARPARDYGNARPGTYRPRTNRRYTAPNPRGRRP
jgi:hypothetical protein